MNLVYVDESGNTGLNLRDAQQPIFVLAALVLKSTDWFAMEEQFYHILGDYFQADQLSAIEIHATDVKAGRKAFKGIELSRRLQIRDRMLALLVKHKIPVIYRRIIKSRFASFCEDKYGPGIKINPYIMALPFVCMEVNHYLHEKGPNELGMLIFDEQKESLVDAEKSLRTLRLDQDAIVKTTRLIEKGFFADSSKCFALQLVDLAAYYIRKYEEYGQKCHVSAQDQHTFEHIRALISTGVGSKTGDILEWVKNHFVP
ncbi:MAG: DUF3800 domain-containing protein [Phycisphaerae bacterium]|nr:DUF3800 domain-containing protein [Phycisphaerae bacterium]